MRIFIRKMLSKVLSKEKKRKFKEVEYKIKKSLINKLPEINEKNIKKILIDDFKIKHGDHLFIHASLDMINTQLSPLNILDILLEIVGEEGSISAPTFIKYSSKDWMEMKEQFHIKKTPSGMGIFSERVRRHKQAQRSLHPTKSVATIGKIAHEILDEHHLDVYPFGEKSPFYKLMNDHNVKIIGLGAPMSYLSMVHTVEDVYKEHYPLNVNEKNVYEKKCISANDEVINVSSYVHNLSVLAKANPEKFVKKYMDSQDYILFKYYLTDFFLVDGKKLYDMLSTQIELGNTIYD